MSKTISIINQDILKRLLLLSKTISEGQSQYEDVLGVTIPLVGEIGNELDDIIFDYLAIPPDTSLCFINDGVNKKEYDENDEECKQCTGCFCRDYLADIVYEFGNGEISLEEVVDKLTNWNVED